MKKLLKRKLRYEQMFLHQVIMTVRDYNSLKVVITDYYKQINDNNHNYGLNSNYDINKLMYSKCKDGNVYDYNYGQNYFSTEFVLYDNKEVICIVNNFDRYINNDKEEWKQTNLLMLKRKEL